MRSGRVLLVSPRAARDLDEIADFIARDNPARALAFVAELEAKCRTVAAEPALYPSREDVAPGLRMAVHGRYLVLYRELPEDNAVRVERVLTPPTVPQSGTGTGRPEVRYIVR